MAHNEFIHLLYVRVDDAVGWQSYVDARSQVQPVAARALDDVEACPLVELAKGFDIHKLFRLISARDI